MTAALELSGNQVTHFYSTKKNTAEMIRMMDVLIEKYGDRRKLYLSWDAASWHISKQLFARIDAHNSAVPNKGGPLIETAPLPAGAQFLNVVESVFSGMARAIIHNSDYKSMDVAKMAIDRYFGDRNAYFQQHPKRAGKKIWGSERDASCTVLTTGSDWAETTSRQFPSPRCAHVRQSVALRPIVRILGFRHRSARPRPADQKCPERTSLKTGH
jgi:hypothetical protein